MPKKTRSHVDDLRGASRLAVEATAGVTALVEEMHRTIAGGPDALGRPLALPTKVVTDVVYGSIKGVTRLVGAGIDGALAQLTPLLGRSTPGPEREAVLAALNGVLGDYLDETDNPLAIRMALRHDGHPLELDDAALAATFPEAQSKVLVLVHGSCMNDMQWRRSGHDHGAALARDLGYTPVYVHYNTGRHCSTNGADLAALLDQLAGAWPTPLEELAFVAHSMGGLVARGACHAAEQAGQAWRHKLRGAVFLGTPHHGAPLERGGNWVDVLLGVSRYSAPLARLGKIRSAGVTDLRFGNVLDEHWSGRDRFEGGDDRRTPLPLPDGVACFAAAGTLAGGGDGLVPVKSALGVHERAPLTLAFPDPHKWVGSGAGHFDLLDRPDVYDQVRGWLADA
jgi:hypothetical protein